MVELMVVSAIISILAAMSFALLTRMRSQVIETNALSALNALATAYEMYYYHNTSYPQWRSPSEGGGQRFESPKQLFDHLLEEEYLPPSFSTYRYEEETGFIYGFTQDYAVEIMPFNPGDPTTSSRNSYFIVFHPYNFQRDALAIGTNPPTGWVAVRPRRGREGGNYRTFGLYTFHRVEGE
jgi:type II secretory pathway pseudopilin PulG